VKTMVIAPHPDDEILGVGGTMLRRKQESHDVIWLIVTAMKPEDGWQAEAIAKRRVEIEKVARLVGVDDVIELGLPSARLDAVKIGDLVSSISAAVDKVRPHEVFVPHIGDVHTDHYAVHRAAISSTKWFRHGSVRSVLAYETLSETDFGVGEPFVPNVFVDIGPYLEKKLQALEIYSSELTDFPFPRSFEAVRSLARVRGAAAGFAAAESFMLLRQRQGDFA